MYSLRINAPTQTRLHGQEFVVNFALRYRGIGTRVKAISDLQRPSALTNPNQFEFEQNKTYQYAPMSRRLLTYRDMILMYRGT